MTTINKIAAAEAVPLVGDGLDIARALLHSGDYDECIGEARAVRSGAHGPIRQMAAVLIEATAHFYHEHYGETLRVLQTGAGLVDSVSDAQRARYFAQRAAALRKRNDKKRADRNAALIDYEAARYWAEEAGDLLTLAGMQNNLAKIYSELGRFDEAIAESDEAISIADKLGDQVYLGRFYDQRAQILIDKKAYSEALVFTEKALRLLEGHPAQAEARDSHGKALIGLGCCYLEKNDPLETLRSRRIASKIIESTPDDHMVNLALQRSGGQIRKAAKLLGMQHSALIKIAQQKGLSRNPQRHRGKPLIKT